MASSVTRIRNIRSDQHYIYLYIQLEFESKLFSDEIEIREFKLIILQSMQTIFGDFGSKIPIDVIKYRPSDRKAFIRTNAKDLFFVRNALTLTSRWKQSVCMFRIHKICHTLSSLAIEPISPLIVE